MRLKSFPANRMLGEFKNGFTLIEVMLALFLMAIICLTAFTVLYQTQNAYVQTDAAIDAEQQLNNLAFTLTKIFSGVQCIDQVNGPISTNIGGTPYTTHGQIRIGNFNQIATGGSGAIVPIANFLRPLSSSTANSADIHTNFMPTGIFYIYPTPTTSGGLFIDMGQNGNLSPSYGNIFFPRLTWLITQAATSPSGVLTGVRFIVSARVFIGGLKANWGWCPILDIQNGVAGCNQPKAAPFSDAIRDFFISFNNQVVLNTSLSNPNRPERIYGGLYVFPILDSGVRNAPILQQ